MNAVALYLAPERGIIAPGIRIDTRQPLLGVIGSILWRFDGALAIAWVDPGVLERRRSCELAQLGAYRLERRIVEDEGPRGTSADTAARFLARRARRARG